LSRPAAPIRYATAKGQDIVVTEIARGRDNPGSIAFASQRDPLVSERPGAVMPGTLAATV